MKKKLCALLSAVMVFSLCVAPAHASELSIGAPDDYLFGRPTSDDTIYEWENPNVDRSKNAALIPPGFGTPTSYLPGSGEYLTPNLVPGALSGGLVNQAGSVGNPNGGTSSVQAAYLSLPATAESSLTPLHLLSPQSLEDGFAGAPWDATGNYPAPGTSVDSNGFPTVSGGSSSNVQTMASTEVTSSMYYANGSLGTLKVPSIGLTVGVYEGTGSAPLLKGAGHFEGTSIWLGNVCVAGHNRGVRNDFGKIHTLKAGDIITFTTVLGTRTYAVSSVTKVSVNDVSGLNPTSANMITLYTCVNDQPAYRWCVKAVEATP